MAEGDRILIQVAINAPFYQLFDYFFSGDYALIQPGIRVAVPFGTRELIGIVVARIERSDYPLDKIKSINAVLDQTPLLPASLFTLCQFPSPKQVRSKATSFRDVWRQSQASTPTKTKQ